MTEPVRVLTPHGRLSYIPERLHHHPETPQSPFQARTCRPRVIRIEPVAPDCLYFTKRTHRTRTSITFGKLAGSRDTAKRFLRSFIASAYGGSTAQTSSTDTSSRRSSDGGRRSRSSSCQEGDSGAAADVTMRSITRSSMSGPTAGIPHRPSLVDSVRTASGQSAASNLSAGNIARIPEDKPVASGNGVSVGISLTEPVLFLQGFEHTDSSDRSTAMLRGNLHLKVTKSAKIKAVTLKFRGRATTKWPEGIPPKKTEFEETDVIMSHTWPFFNAQFPTAESGTCADHVELKTPSASIINLGTSKHRNSVDSVRPVSPNRSSMDFHNDPRLSLRVTQSRSFGKGDSATNGPSVAQKGYRTFNPGDYIYSFELPLDSHLPETIDVDLGSVKYELEATIERAGAFRANLIGSKEVVLIRAPSEASLEQIEPIAISRNWEDQLHYDIVISGKSFPMGAQVPIAFKLTPLAKVQCHRIKVFVTENIEYYCNNKRVHRMEPTRKIQLFEKRADGPSTSTYAGSSMRIISGGGIPYDQRAAAARGEEVLPPDSMNLLGNLESNINVGPTEMEFNVQLPRCQSMKEKERSQRLHFDTTYQNIQVHHWIKIVMRLSKPDENDRTKRRHFEISIDSPFHILSCQATQANTALPAYSSPESAGGNSSLYECGCPGAAVRRTTPTGYVPTLGALNGTRDGPHPLEQVQSPRLARPEQAHLGGPINQSLQRPIHMLRAPSYNPPAFEDEEPPPPLETPPPHYDSIASPTSGLADYFSRLSDAYDDDSDNEGDLNRRGRVNIPLTPGGRVNRSLDERRTWLPVGHVAQ